MNDIYKTIGQNEMAERLGLSVEELLALIPQGIPAHAHPSSHYGEYRFHESGVEQVRAIVNCLTGGGHEWQFDHYYDTRLKLPVMVCKNCGLDSFPSTPYTGNDAPKLSTPRVTGEPATEKQLAYLQKLNAWYAPDITKREASDLIDEAKQRVVSPTLYYVKPIQATCERCGVESPVEEMVDGKGGYDWDNPDEDFQGSIHLMSYRCADGHGCQANRQANAEAARITAEVEHYGRYDDNSPGQIGGGKI